MNNYSIKGFTLVELLVAMVCFSMIIGTAYSVFFKQYFFASSEQSNLNMQMNLRVAMERIGFVFSNAGFGNSDSFKNGRTMSGDDPDNSTITIDSFIWDVDNNAVNGSNSDSVVVLYGYKKIAEVDAQHNSTNSIDLKNIKTPSLESSSGNFKNYICFFPNIEGDLFYSLTNAEDPITIAKSISLLPDDADVYIVSPVRVKIAGDNNDTLYLQNFVYNSNQYWEVAENIQDLQIQYTEDGNSWLDTPNDGNEVQGIRFFLLARSAERDKDYVDRRTYTYAGQTAGPFNDHYHRKLSESTVWIRNAQ